MKLDVFTMVIESIENQTIKNQKVADIGIDLLDYEDDWIVAMTLMFNAYYGADGWKWIAWYLFERPATDPPTEAFDGKVKICFDIPSLWKHIETIRVSEDFVEYELPKSKALTEDDLYKIFPGYNRS